VEMVELGLESELGLRADGVSSMRSMAEACRCLSGGAIHRLRWRL
jgi:hypothetical protein